MNIRSLDLSQKLGTILGTILRTLLNRGPEFRFYWNRNRHSPTQIHSVSAGYVKKVLLTPPLAVLGLHHAAWQLQYTYWPKGLWKSQKMVNEPFLLFSKPAETDFTRGRIHLYKKFQMMKSKSLTGSVIISLQN